MGGTGLYRFGLVAEDEVQVAAARRPLALGGTHTHRQAHTHTPAELASRFDRAAAVVRPDKNPISSIVGPDKNPISSIVRAAQALSVMLFTCIVWGWNPRARG